MSRPFAFALLLLGACSQSAELGGGSSESSSGSSSTTATPTTPPPPTDECTQSGECEGDAVCVAPYDAGGSGRGTAVCVDACVDADDLGRWCVDDSACCPGLRCQEIDGFCEPIEVVTTGDDESSSG